MNSTKILSRGELLTLFNEQQPDEAITAKGDAPGQAPAESVMAARFVVGMVGYPNVGKSSTINSLVGAKKVNVGITPGKTKHFQTIHLSDDVVLCDCPGLVFPTFMNSAADLVVNGILPIDNLRDHMPPMEEVARRVGKGQLAQTYGLRYPDWKLVDGQALLDGYSASRGYYKDKGTLDDTRSARIILKNFIQGKLLYCHPPPGDRELRKRFASSLGGGQGTINKLMMRKTGEDDGKDDIIVEGVEGAEEPEEGAGIIPVEFEVTRSRLFQTAPEMAPEDFLMEAQLNTKKSKDITSQKAAMRAAKPRGRKKKGRNKDVNPYEIKAHTVGVAGIGAGGSLVSPQPKVVKASKEDDFNDY